MTLAITSESILAQRSQTLSFGPERIKYFGETAYITVQVRFDDTCNNGHNSFSITADIRNGRREIAGGCLHDEVAMHFPHLAPYIKWHLCSTDGPMHYIANTVYHVECGKLDYARSSAVWPDATDEDLTAPGLKQRLEDRLPALLVEFRKDVESLGLVW